MSCLYRNVKFLVWWQSVCSASSSTKLMKTWSRMKQMNRSGSLWTWGLCFGGWFVNLIWEEVWYAAIMRSIRNHSSSTLVSFKSHTDILDRIADITCDWTWIRGQEISMLCLNIQLSEVWKGGVSKLYYLMPAKAVLFGINMEAVSHIVTQVLKVA